MGDWQPAQYLKYKNERTQPSIDLVNRIAYENPKRIIDIGCGPGNSTAILKDRWPHADIYGLDNSKSMIQQAKMQYPDLNWLLMSTGDNLAALGQFDIVFTNAALQWMPEHERLIPNMYNMLAENGILAAQVPCVKQLPIYAKIQTLIRSEKWARFFESPPLYPRHYPFEHYYNIISELTDKIDIWQTDYIHILPNHDGIVEWYKGTGLRPFLDMLPAESDKMDFCSDYRELISEAYRVEKDGRVLLPFTRIFFMMRK